VSQEHAIPVSKDTALDPATQTPTLHVESSQALPLVAMTVAFRAGSIEDPPGKEGLVRFTSRLMRRTAGGLSAHEIDTRIDSLGASLASDVSHSTTGFNAAVIARSLDPFAGLLEDVFGRPAFGEAELALLRRETESELIESRDNDRALARRWFRKKLFDGHPYARSVSGTIESVKSFDESDVKNLYRRLVTSRNVVFAFAGMLEPGRAEELAGRLSGVLPVGALLTDATPDPELRSGRHLVIVDKPERTQTQILIGGRGTHPSDRDHIALHVANTVFGGTFTARMTREIRSKRGWSYGAYSSLPYDRRRQAFSMWTFPKAQDAAACVKLKLELLKAWRDEGITKSELAWAKRYLVRSHAFAVDTAAKRVGLKLEADLYQLPPGYHEEYLERIQAVTLEQANLALKDRISADDLLVCVVGTEQEIGGAVREAITDLKSSEVVAFDTDA
jgi:zinc protease